MKSVITLLSLLFFISGIFAQEDHCFDTDNLFDDFKLTHPDNVDKTTVDEIVWLRDSIYYYAGEGSTWNLNWRLAIQTRDENHNPVKEFAHFWNEDNGTWGNKDSIFYSYYGSGEEDVYLRWSWNSEVETWSDTAYYQKINDNGNKLESFLKLWNYSNNVFFYGVKSEYLYDENDNQIERLSFAWNEETSTWDNNSLSTNTYDENGNILERLVKSWNTAISEWVDDTRSFYSYDVNSNLIEILREQSITTDVWIELSRITNTYDGNNLKTHSLFERFFNGNWESSSQHIYAYHTSGNIGGDLYQIWNNEVADWENRREYSFSYDENDNLIEYLRYDWDDAISNWEYKVKRIYYWSEHDVVSTDNINFIEGQVSPNPTSGIINISSDISLENARVEIYAVSGKTMQTIQLDNQRTIDISRLPNGVYFVNILTKEGRLIKKVQKI